MFLQHGGGDEEGRKDSKKAAFNSEEIEKLIDLWHKEPVLYNC